MGGGDADSLGPLRGESPPALLEPPQSQPQCCRLSWAQDGLLLFPLGQWLSSGCPLAGRDGPAQPLVALWNPDG